MSLFHKITASLIALVFFLSLAVAASNAQGRHGWNWGRHDNGRHLGWYKNRGRRSYYRYNYYPRVRYYRYRRASYYGYYPTYYRRYRYRTYYQRRYYRRW